MTPEERFRNIEDLLNMVAQNQVLFHGEMQELREVQARQEKEIEKHTSAIPFPAITHGASSFSGGSALEAGRRPLCVMRQRSRSTRVGGGAIRLM